MCVPISMEAWTRDITGKGIRVNDVFQVPHETVKTRLAGRPVNGVLIIHIG